MNKLTQDILDDENIEEMKKSKRHLFIIMLIFLTITVWATEYPILIPAQIFIGIICVMCRVGLSESRLLLHLERVEK